MFHHWNFHRRNIAAHMPDTNHLILISGLPGTGKTTLGRMLGEQLGCPFFSKDDLKESLYRSSGAEWLRTREAGIAIEDTLWSLARAAFRGTDRVILESTFIEEVTRESYEILKGTLPDLTSLNLWCRADEEERRDRIERRSLERSGVHDRAREIGDAWSLDLGTRLGYCDDVVEYRVGIEIEIIRIVG